MGELDFDLAGLQAWLAEQTGEDLSIDVERLKGGGSCEMFSMQRGGQADDQRWAIRRAPVSAVSSTAHNVVREYKIILAMQNSAVRVPALLAACDDTSIMGAPFYVMGYIEGEVIRHRLPDTYLADPASQVRIGEEIVDALAELHSFDWRGTAIEDLAKPENFLQRQVDRWMNQLEGYRNRDMGGVDETAKWLRDNLPQNGDLCVMHGDYKAGNAMFSPSAPPEILALVDFEMTTVGDPLIDLAWAMIFWPEEGNLLAIAAPGGKGGMTAEYCQTPQQLEQRYAEHTGRSLDNYQWYQAFSAWKLGIVLEASYAKYLQGTSKNPQHEFFGFMVDELMKRAQRFAI